MAYLLDTNIAIHARDGTEAVLRKLEAHEGAVLLSALSLAELQLGLYKHPAETAARKARLDVMMAHLPVLPFDAAAAQVYGQIIEQYGGAKGRDFDRMIAAHAMTAGAVLVTNNVGEFAGIAGLRVENWVAG